mgnify:CR=1 FL=1
MLAVTRWLSLACAIAIFLLATVLLLFIGSLLAGHDAATHAQQAGKAALAVLLLAALLASITGVLSAWSTRRGFAVVGSIAVLVLGGGVAANSLLRERFLTACADASIRGFLPSPAMCTDNAAMIAAAGWHRLRSDGPSALDCGAYPNLRLTFS